MKNFIKAGFKPVDSLNAPDDGHRWSIMQKLLLGLSPQEYFQQLRRNPLNWLLFLIFAVGLPVIVYRYIFGLGSVMHGSYDYPWGLFLGFGLFCMVPLSASGFLLSSLAGVPLTIGASAPLFGLFGALVWAGRKTGSSALGRQALILVVPWAFRLNESSSIQFFFFNCLYICGNVLTGVPEQVLKRK